MRAHYKSWIGLALSVVFLFLALRNVEWPDVWKSWRAARLDLLLLGVVLLIGSWMVAAVRWRILLLSSKRLRVRDTFAYITIGYLANTVLPLRLGDLARASLIGRKKAVGISRSLGSIAVERVMDLLMLAAITLMIALIIEIPAPIQAGLTTMMGAALIALTGLIALSFNQSRLPGLSQWLSKVMPGRLADRILVLLKNFSSGADVFRQPMGLLAVVSLSALVWGLVGLATLVWIWGFHLEVPWFAGFFVLIMVNLGSAIPSSPGYVGVYHYLAVLALSLWVPDRSAALAYAIGSHALNMLANVGLGAYFLTREGISLRDLRAQAGSQKSDAA